MPEGDTIYRTAQTLSGVLVGRTVTGFRSPLPPVAREASFRGVVGSQVIAVESVGKHLVIRFSGGAMLRTHMRMHGSWHVYRPGSPWQRPAQTARVVLETGEAVAVCFSAPDVELTRDQPVERHDRLGSLGPDLLGATLDEAEALRRLQRRGGTEIGNALLDQTVMAGVGNVYKSEVLFLCRVNPWRRVAELDETALGQLIHTAARLLRQNLRTNERRTTSFGVPGALWVYDRAARPCRQCGTLIQRCRQGELGRVTYWCASCQQ
ncbi:MAG: DNA-formamidopyrimidine glycosylase family protein [Chloroflexota bacterium]